jgi:hypothetical protein
MDTNKGYGAWRLVPYWRDYGHARGPPEIGNMTRRSARSADDAPSTSQKSIVEVAGCWSATVRNWWGH